MKKIYTLIALVMMTISAYALPMRHQNLQPVKISDDALARSQMRLDNLVNDILNNREVAGLEKRKVEIDGLDYTAYFLNHGPATRVAKDWKWGECLYDIDFVVLSTDSPITEYYSYSVLWPTQTIVNLLNTDSAEEGDFAVDNTMVPIDEMLEMNDDFVQFKFIYDNPGYVNIAAFDDDDYVIGWFAYIVSGVKDGKKIAGINKGATLTVHSLNLKVYPYEEDITMFAEVLDAKYNSGGDNNVISNININYKGKIEGWPPKDEIYSTIINEVHIAYTGIYHGANGVDSEPSNWPYYDQFFPAMKRYYINMCNENMAYDLSQWHDATYPYYHASAILNLGEENNPHCVYDDPNLNYAFIQGSFWTPADKIYPYYLEYTQVATDIENGKILNVPEPYTTQQAFDNSFEFAVRDGMTGAWFSRYIDWFNVQLSIGGMDGIVFKAVDIYNNIYEATMSEGEIYYHYDPEDMSKYKMISVRRTHDIESILNDATVVRGADGMIKVSCEGIKDVVIHSISGVKVGGGSIEGEAGFAVEPGVYIVKVSDKSYKVIL